MSLFPACRGSSIELKLESDLGKRKKARVGTCVYCGREGPITDDHIPPKCIFPEILHKSLLKIPSCTGCNNGSSKDDEYLRTIIVLSARTHRDEALEQVTSRTVRSLVRAEASGFREGILTGLREMFAQNERGVFVPATFGRVDLTRLDRVITRIIKGLFYAENSYRLPDDYKVVNYSAAGLTQVPEGIALTLAANVSATMETSMKLVGGPQFAFWSQYESADPRHSSWVIAMYRTHSFVGWTVRSAEGQGEATASHVISNQIS